MEQPYQCTGAKTKFRPKLPPAQIAPAYPTRFFFYKKVENRLINKNFLKKSAILLMKSFLTLSYLYFHNYVEISKIHENFLIHNTYVCWWHKLSSVTDILSIFGLL